MGSDAQLAVTQTGGEIVSEKCMGNVRIPMHHYKSLRAAVMTCDILVNTHTHTHRQLLTGYTINSASWAKN